MTGISREVGGLRKNLFHGGAMDNFWGHTMYFKSPGKVLLKPRLCEGPRGEGYLKIEKRWVEGVKTSCGYGYGYYGYLSPAKYIHDKGNKNKDDKHF